MRRDLWLAVLVALLLGSAGFVWAAADMKIGPGWEKSFGRFSSDGTALVADGQAMPLMMDFTWSAPESEEMVKYQGQFLGNAHYRNFELYWDGQWDWKRVDEIYRWGAAHKVYIVAGLNVAHARSYIQQDPTAAAKLADGKSAGNNLVAFTHPGYRQALAKALGEFAAYVSKKPYHLGYYPQDEFAYRELSGYEPCGLDAFRQWIVKKRGSLAKINEAWGSAFARVEDIEPPRQVEQTMAFADWNEFRRWAQMDFARLVYDSLKGADKDHVVIWSLPFYGYPQAAASWWAFAPVSDVLMRHGIGYSTGLFRLKMLSAVSEWSGKPGNALCMPPAHDPSFVQMSFLLDGPQSGLSHVCTAGTDDHTYYRGSADPAADWKRREPMYTQSRAFNDLARQMGDTMLRGHPRRPQVGVYVSDRQVMLSGTNNNSLNGLLMMLADLNLDFEIVSELSWDRLRGYRALVLGDCSRCATPEMADDVRQFVSGGGLLVMTRNAFVTDENNLPVEAAQPGFGLEDLVGSTEAGTAALKPQEPLVLMPGEFVATARSLPVLGQASVRKVARDTTVLAEIPGKGAVITSRPFGQGKVLYFGNDPGLPYQAGYTEDFAGVARKFNKTLLDDQAGFHFDATTGAEDAVKLQSHKGYAQLIGAFLEASGISPRVNVQQYADAVGAVKALSFRSGSDYWVGLANRLVRPGKDHELIPADQYHQVLSDLRVAVEFDEGTAPAYAVNMPLGKQTEDGFTAMPELLALTHRAGAARATGEFVLPQLADCAAVVLTASHEPVLGLAAGPRALVAGQDIQITVRAVNPSPRPVRLQLELDGSPGLISGQQAALACPAGGAAEASLKATVRRSTRAGYETLQVVATTPDGKRLFSPSAEIQVLPDITVEVAGAGQTLFPLVDAPSVVTVRAVNNRPEAGSMTVELSVGAGYRATPAQQTVRLSGGGTAEVALKISGDSNSPALANGKLTVTTTGGGVTAKRQQALRMARAVAAYVDRRKVQPLNSAQERRVVPLACLENRYLRAEWIVENCTLHSLIPRETGRDVMLEGDYPIGLKWYALPGDWKQTKLSADEQGATLVLQGGPEGKITMTATLRREDRQVKIVYDCGDLAARSETFYLMTRPDLGMKDDITVAPTTAGRKTYTRGLAQLPAADIAASWIAVEGPTNQMVLGIAYDFPTLKEISFNPNNFANYVMFTPGDQPPGQITFWLTAQQGDADTVEAWAKTLGK